MPAVFKKIKVKAKTGRGEGTDGMLQEFLKQYDDIKTEFDKCDEADKQAVIDTLNGFQGGLGDAFGADKVDFECEATSINDHGEFFKVMRDDCGFDVEGI